MDLFPQHLERVVGRASPEVFQDPHHRQGLEVARRLDSARVDGPGPAEVGADLGDLLLRLCIVAGDEHVGRAAGKLRRNHVRVPDRVEALHHACLREHALHLLGVTKPASDAESAGLWLRSTSTSPSFANGVICPGGKPYAASSMSVNVIWNHALVWA